MRQTHASLYRVPSGLVPSKCPGMAEDCGVVHCRELGRKVALWNCRRCNSLIAQAAGQVIWEMEVPPAAAPVATKEGATP